MQYLVVQMNLACNYDADANVDDGSCQFAEDNFNCDGELYC